MSETFLTVEDAAIRLPEVISQITADRQSAVITQNGEPIARITPITAEESGPKLAAILRRWRDEHPVMDESFCRAIEESRAGIHPPVDPWRE